MLSKHPLYGTWGGMVDRCYNPRNKSFARYGGRGIEMCYRWIMPCRRGFWNFVEDMSPRPDGLTIDRIDNNVGYSPENCRWATKKQQQWNLHNCRKVVIDGVEHVAAELSYLSGLKTDSIIARAGQGLSLADVLKPEKRLNIGGLGLGGAVSGEKRRKSPACKHGHTFDENNTYITKEGWRRCRACRAERMRRCT